LKSLLLIGLITLAAGCNDGPVSDEQIQKVIAAHPELIIQAIEKNPDKVLEILTKSMEAKRTENSKKAQQAQLEQREKEFKEPKKPKLAADQNFRGAKDAKITIVEYSDFQCIFCNKATSTIEEVLKKYDGKVKLVYKNLPIPQLHPQAMLAAQYYSAIEMQNKDFAWKFYDEVFKNQARFPEGDKYFIEVAQKIGADLNKLAKDVSSDKVKNRIKEDMDEAQSFGFTGTPAFLINGVSLVGAQPIGEFSQIIDRQLKES
jgi:protein-disulfide isomerase